MNIFHMKAVTVEELGPLACQLSKKRTGPGVLKTTHDHPVHCSAIERPAQMKMGQWLREEKAKL